MNLKRDINNFFTSSPKRDLSEITKLKLEVARRNATYSVSDRLKHLCFKSNKIDKDGYVEYLKNFKIMNLTSEVLETEQVSVFKVKALSDVIIDLHDHKSQSQTIYVNKGRLLVVDSAFEVFEGESFFIKKKKRHEIKYTKGSEATIVYLPNLKKIY